MGTVVSIDIRDALAPDRLDAMCADVSAFLHDVDATFSTYREGSFVSRLARGETRRADCPTDVAEVLAHCERLSAETGGAFDPRYRGDGTLDPTGLVKGWAIRRATDLLAAAGLRRFAVNGGGDVQTVGTPAPGQLWRVAIANPLRPGEVATVVAGAGVAVATSGVAERGAHIYDPFTGRPATGLASVTVVAHEMVEADVLATASFAMGPGAFGWLSGLGCAAYVVAADGRKESTTPFAAYAAA
jgi:FAD:protein FMN transferase